MKNFYASIVFLRAKSSCVHCKRVKTTRTLAIIAGVLIMVIVLMYSSATAASKFLLTGRGEWGFSLNRQRSGAASYGNSTADQAYQFSLSGPVIKNIAFNSSASLGQWGQSNLTGSGSRHVTNRKSISNNIFVPLKRNMSLTLRQYSNWTKSPLSSSHQTLGGTFKGVIFKSGPNFTLEGERLAQSQETASGDRSLVSYRENLRIDKMYKRFSFEAVQSLDSRRLPGSDHYVTNWSVRTRPIWKISDASRLMGAYSTNQSQYGSNHSGNIDYSNQVTQERGYSAGVSYASSSSHSLSGYKVANRNMGATAAGRSSQAIVYDIDHLVNIRSHLSLARRSGETYSSNDLNGFVSLDNKLQRAFGGWSMASSYSITIENSHRAWVDLGTVHYFETSAYKRNTTSSARVEYSVEAENTDLDQTRHNINAEWQSMLSPEFVFTSSGSAQFSRFRRAGSDLTVRRQQYSALTGLELRLGRRSISLRHQVQISKATNLDNIRNFTRTIVTWPLNRFVVIEGQAQLLFESQSSMRRFDCQTQIVWPVAALELRATVRYRNSKVFSTVSSGGYVGVRISRNIRGAF